MMRIEIEVSAPQSVATLLSMTASVAAALDDAESMSDVTVHAIRVEEVDA